jgi:regulatory protein YycH of two-component signal transduction system YycFG
MKSLTPLLIIALAFATIYWFAYPTYKGLDTLKDQKKELQDAIARADKASTQLVEKRNRYESFSDEHKQWVASILPDKIDNLRWIVELSSVASRHGGKVADVRVVEDPRGPSAEIGAVNISFKTTMPYDKFLTFLTDLQRSLKLTDVVSADFQTAEKTNTYDYTVNLRTYWLK